MGWCVNVCGVMSLNMSVAMNVHVDDMHQHLVCLVHHCQSHSTRLKRTARTRPSTPTFVMVRGKRKHEEPAFSQHHQQQSGHPSTAKSLTTVATTEPRQECVRTGACHEASNEPTCQTMHFDTMKSVMHLVCTSAFCEMCEAVRACYDALPLCHKALTTRMSCSMHSAQ